MDGQSIYGKTPIGVAKLEQAAGKAVIAIVGSLREDYEVVYQQGINAVFPMIRQADTVQNMLQQGRKSDFNCAKYCEIMGIGTS